MPSSSPRILAWPTLWALGCPVDLVVGDLDSVDLEQLADARRDGAAIEAHPRDKDQTDLELALDAALARGARADHRGRRARRSPRPLRGQPDAPRSPRYRGACLDAWMGEAHVVVVRDDVELDGHPGVLLTLVPLGGPACGIRTTGSATPSTTRTSMSARAAR